MDQDIKKIISQIENNISNKIGTKKITAKEMKILSNDKFPLSDIKNIFCEK